MRRMAFTLLGIVVILMGSLWTLQGLGLVQWPADSFMLGKRTWANAGVLTIAAGAILVWLSLRRRNRD